MFRVHWNFPIKPPRGQKFEHNIVCLRNEILKKNFRHFSMRKKRSLICYLSEHLYFLESLTCYLSKHLYFLEFFQIFNFFGFTTISVNEVLIWIIWIQSSVISDKKKRVINGEKVGKNFAKWIDEHPQFCILRFFFLFEAKLHSYKILKIFFGWKTRKLSVLTNCFWNGKQFWIQKAQANWCLGHWASKLLIALFFFGEKKLSLWFRSFFFFKSFTIPCVTIFLKNFFPMEIFYPQYFHQYILQIFFLNSQKIF